VAHALAAADAGGVVLAGPAGVGKTRLAVECGRLAEERGLRSSRVLATRPASTIPLGALAPLLPALAGRLELRADLLAWAADAIAARDERVLLIADDAHLLDDASAVVVHQLAQSGRAFVVATLRSGETVPEPVHALWKDGLARRLEVGPLDDGEVDRLLDAVLDGAVDGACRRDLREASGGNPLVLHELVVGAIEAGVLTSSEGVWRLSRSLAATPRLVELVNARLVELDPAEHDALELLAVGEPLGLGFMAGLAGVEVVERLERHQLLEVTGRGAGAEVRLGHPLYGEALRERMTALRVMAANRRLADASETLADLDPADVLRVAVWRLDGGGHVDHDLMLAAARRAYFAHDDELALRLARQAWSSGGGIRAGLLLAQVLGALGRHEDRAELDVELAGRAKTDEERALVAMDHAIALWWGLRQGDAAADVLASAEAALDPGGWRDELVAQRATFDLLAGRFDEALARGRPVLDDSPSERAHVTAAIAVAPALAVMGRGSDALAVADAAFATHLSLTGEEVLSDPGIHVVSRVLALNESGRLDEALQTATVAYDMAVALRNETGQAWFALMLGRVALASGRLADAAGHFREGAAVFRALGQDGPRRWCLAGQALAAAMRAEPAAAAAAWASVAAVPDQPIMMMEADVLRAAAWEALAGGDLDAAHAGLLDATRVAESAGAATLAQSAWHDLARIGFAASAVAPLTELAGRVEGPLSAVRAAHARALADHDVDGLTTAADDFEAGGAILAAAEAAAAASATAHRRHQARLAERLSRRSRALADRCQGARTPGLLLAGASRALTGREREVAALAAEGLASKAIAGRLGLAVRTVDNHLQRAYEKLGVSDRTGLREVLAESSE
jgi:DNA-binding NarL/FixJ family response regulator